MATIDYSAWTPWDYKTALGLVYPDAPNDSNNTGALYEYISGSNQPRTVMSADGKYALSINKYGQVEAINGERWGDAENTRYYGAGLLDPRLSQAAANYASTPDKLDDFIGQLYLTDPAEAAMALGRLNDRGTYSTGSGDPTAFAPENYWGAILGGSWDNQGMDNSAALAQSLGLRNSDNQAISNWWNNYMSSGAQSARDDQPEGLFGMGDLGTILSLAALAWGIPTGLEALGLTGTTAAAGTAAGTAGLGLGTGTAVAGLGTGTSVAGFGLGTAATSGLFSAAELASLFPGAFATTAGAAAAGGSMGLFDDLSWLFDEAASSSADPLYDLIQNQTSFWTDPANVDLPSWMFEEALDPSAGLSLSNLSKYKSYLDTGSSIAKLLGVGSGALGSYLSGSAASDASSQYAAAQIEAAKIAADAAKFKPVGVTTRFGSSDFGYDANGNLISAGYTLDPAVKAQQDQLMAMSQGYLDQYGNAKTATAPMGDAAQRAMQLGMGYLSTDPLAQAQKYMSEQQAVLASSRERELANLQNKLIQQGVGGLATGGTSTMGASNPQLEAYYNALMQQDLELAAKATQGGMDYAKFGAGMVGTGGDLLQSMYGTQSAAYNPYSTVMGGASYLEGLGQNAMDMGINIGAKGTAANAASGALLAQGMQNAASSTQQANSYSPWGSMLQGLGQSMQQYAYNPYTGQPVNWGT